MTFLHENSIEFPLVQGGGNKMNYLGTDMYHVSSVRINISQSWDPFLQSNLHPSFAVSTIKVHRGLYV